MTAFINVAVLPSVLSFEPDQHSSLLRKTVAKTLSQMKKKLIIVFHLVID